MKTGIIRKVIICLTGLLVCSVTLGSMSVVIGKEKNEQFVVSELTVEAATDQGGQETAAGAKKDGKTGKTYEMEKKDSKAKETSAGMDQEKNKKKQSGKEKKDFYKMKISDEIFERMEGNSYKDNCAVPRKDLRYLHILHKNLEGETLEGEMVCHKTIADDLLEIFEELYKKDYPIEKMKLVDDYDADDEASMTDNNSSCFNYRTISHSSKISKHGLGIAVDINPLYNPYTKKVNGKRTVEPKAGEPYLDRDDDFPYKIDKKDLCYKLFIDHGFKWGGAWNSCKDYQHFELPNDQADKLRDKYD